jgi:hypothetical protein
LLLPNPYGDLKMVYSEDRSTQKDTSSSAVTSSLSDLIARLERAGNGSRDLDSDIFAFLNPSLFRTARPGSFVTDEKYIKSASDWSIVGITKTAPNYTKSIDAAMTLVPEGMEKDFTDLYGVARVSVGINAEPGPFYGTHEGGSLAIALCIAALRARSLPAI